MASLKDLLGKANAGAAKPANAGLIIKPQAEPPTPAPVQSAEPPRPLGEPSFDIPFEFPSDKQSEGAREWLKLRQLPEASLCMWIEPGMEYGWIGIRNHRLPEEKPLLISRMKIWMASGGQDPF